MTVVTDVVMDQASPKYPARLDWYPRAYFASTVRLFRFSGLPVRFKRSEIIGEAAKLESQYFRCPGLQQPKPLQAGIHPI